jgi:subfamily B ATP-binding cassette protein MsbA
MTDNLSLREKAEALARVAAYRPLLTAVIISVSILAALLEGIGLSFLLPIIRLAQGDASPEQASGLFGGFVSVYRLIGVPFTLEYVVVGVALVMMIRYSMSFLVSWLRAYLQQDYVVFLKESLFRRALGARIGYFDTKGSDELLNAVVTQANQAGTVIERIVTIVEQGFLSLVYLSIALYIAPLLTVGAALTLGAITFVVRTVVPSGYGIGSRIAAANERVHQAAQGGIQGIRDVKLFGLSDELYGMFTVSVEESASASVTLTRNEAAIDNLYELLTAVTVFVLIYVALTYLSLSIAGLGVFLFAMFRLAPRISTLNNFIYQLDGDLPHLIRTQELLEELGKRSEPNDSDGSPPSSVDEVRFDDIRFSYKGTESVLSGISFEVQRGEFIAFVGPSGAGKSTIVSLLSRLYMHDEGEILADGTPLGELSLEEWREHVSVVRQQPHIFNDTLWRNITVGDRDAPEEAVKQVCETAQVTEFLDDLPNGYETDLGDDGVRLSGGQRQRIAVARALLKDADFLILDEATSDLDSNIEEKVHSAIESMDRDYAMLVIAHRLSTVTAADRIYAMRDGKIVEQGTHEKLLESKGVYADLYETQAVDRPSD